MATLDDGIVNLQRFIAHLVSAKGGLEKSVDHFREEEQTLGALEGEAAEEGGGLNDELGELGSQLDAARAETEDALTELAQAATAAQGTVAEAQARIDEAGADVAARAMAILGQLDEAHRGLVAEGFEALGRTLDDAQQQLDAQAQEGEQASAELESAVTSLDTEAQTAWDAVSADLDDALSDIDQAETALEAAASEAVQGFDSAATEFEQACSSLESAVDLVYDVLDQDLVEQGQEWEQRARSLAADGAAFVEAAEQERLQPAVTLVEEEALGSLDQEHSAVGAVIDGAAATAGELEPLAEELAKCRSVLGQIDQLLNALAG